MQAAQIKPLVTAAPMPEVTIDNPVALVTQAQVPAVVVPKETWLTRFEKSPTGEALGVWGRGVGIVGANVLPAAAMGYAGSLIGGIHAAVGSEATGWGIGLGIVAGIGAAIYSSNQGVDLYTKEKASQPWLRTFRDVAVYLMTPAIVVGTAVAEYSTGGYGVIASVVAGLAGASFALTVDGVREKRLDEAKKLGH